MKPDPRFLYQPREFWAHVRLLSQAIGYTDRKTKMILVPSATKIRDAMTRLGHSWTHLYERDGSPTEFGKLLGDYFAHRAKSLNDFVEPRLMDAERARAEFERLRSDLSPSCPLPMNKQKGDKRSHAYLTCIVNMLVESQIGDRSCDYDPRELTSFSRGGVPLRTLARRVDGAFPCARNPVAVWEIKEYYYTTTFGSRIADGVYETLLDGLELEEANEHAGVHCHHTLFVDAYHTWWVMGKSYLCRLIDVLNMGLVSELIFGYEVVERLPALVEEWIAEIDGAPDD